MKRILLLVFIITSGVVYGQGVSIGKGRTDLHRWFDNAGKYTPLPIPPGYTKINARYNWIAGYFDTALHLPGYNGTPTGNRTGSWVGDGAIAMDTTTGTIYGRFNGTWVAAGGATPGLQDVITQDPVLTANNDIDGGGFTLKWTQNIATTGGGVFLNHYNIINTSSTAAPSHIVNNNLELNIGGSGSIGTPRNVYGVMNFTSSTSSSSAKNASFDMNVNGSGTIGGSQANGIDANLIVGATGNVSVYSGFRTSVQTTAGSNIGIYEGVSIDAWSNAGTAGDIYGFYYGGYSNTGAGTTNNSYGLWIDSLHTAGTTNTYAIYTKNGNVRLGALPTGASTDSIMTWEAATGVVRKRNMASITAGSVPISGLLPGTATNSINNGAFWQEWNWNSMTGLGLLLQSNSTASTNNSTLLIVAKSGANATSGIETRAATFTNGNTGTSSTNYGISVSAAGGTVNNAINIAAGALTLNGSAGTSGQVLTSAGANTLPTWETPTGGGGTPAGNYGNLQINRNGAFATAASDTITYLAASGLTVLNVMNGNSFLPNVSDGGALGSTSKQFSDLFLAEGGVINWDAGDATLTQAGNVVTLAGADLTVPNATVSALTAGRIIYSGTAGLLSSTANMTWDGSQIKVTSAGGLATGVRAKATDNTSYASMQLEDHDGGTQFLIGLYGSAASAPSEAFFYQIGANPISFYTQSLKRLDISGAGVITAANLAGSGSRAVVADANGVLSAPVSDRSVKSNINSLYSAIGKIMRLRPVTFEFKEGWKNHGEGVQIGFIAQEVADVLPNSVFITPSTGKMGFNSQDMIPLLVRAMQEQQHQIDQLKKEIRKLKRK